MEEEYLQLLKALTKITTLLPILLMYHETAITHLAFVDLQQAHYGIKAKNFLSELLKMELYRWSAIGRPLLLHHIMEEPVQALHYQRLQEMQLSSYIISELLLQKLSILQTLTGFLYKNCKTDVADLKSVS